MANRKTKTQKRKRKLADGEYRQTCYICFRPIDRCFCSAIPNVDNETEVLILQHRRERDHPFNTARIVRQALSRCQLFVERNEQFANLELPIRSGAALLYPGPDSVLLSDLEPEDRPTQLVLLDGTWHHAKTLFRDIPQLANLPKVQLAPTTPGQYRIRLEPTATSLSTLEATVGALKEIDSNHDELDRLVTAFDTMVQQQLAHPDANYTRAATDSKNTNINVPKSLTEDLNRIVITYGESTPVSYHSDEGWSSLNSKKKVASKMPPVYWTAQRLGGDETFSCFIESSTADLSERRLLHLGLTQGDFENAVSTEIFRQRWREFLRDDDILVVPNRQAIRLLHQSGISVGKHETLRSINHDPLREFKSLTSFLHANSCSIDPPLHRGRAGERLARIAALVRFLNRIDQSSK